MISPSRLDEGFYDPFEGAELLPTVSVVVPTLDEIASIDGCLDAIAAQGYPGIVEVLVVDGGSSDGTVARCLARGDVEVLANPDRIQAAAINIALAHASGDVTVRVDGHCRIAPDYVERAVAAIESSGAAMVGGGMNPTATGAQRAGIAAAMRSRFGVGPARFHGEGEPGWVDTVYLGVFRTNIARKVGGYDARMVANEDAEFAHRMARHGGIWFDPSIRSTYSPRSTLPAVARQFHRYGRYRARTVVWHPESLRPRQLAPVALVVGLVVLPRRRQLAALYAVVVAAATVLDGTGGPAERASFAGAVPVMHLSWGAGFIRGVISDLLGGRRGRR
ncbi:MAG TPA: glycosyltransferase family 2 protein [Micromonosporaceae bacterium]